MTHARSQLCDSIDGDVNQGSVASFHVEISTKLLNRLKFLSENYLKLLMNSFQSTEQKTSQGSTIFS